MKKKKSKKQASDFAKELDELDAEQNDEEISALPADDGAITGENGEKIEAWVAEGRGATYPEVRLLIYVQGWLLTNSSSDDSSQCYINTTPNSQVINVNS